MPAFDATSQALSQDLQIFYGAATESSAHVYARLAIGSERSGLRLTGFVRGPRAEGVRTLPTSVELVDLGPGASLLARAVLPDPSFWSPDVPAVYDVTVELRDGERHCAAVTRSFGIRRFGVRGSSLYLDGRRWVLRGIMLDRVEKDEVDLLRATNTSIVAVDPQDDLCDLASRQGMVVAALLHGGESSVRAALLRLGRWPAVAIAMIDADIPAVADLKSAAPNIELARLCHSDRQAAPAWATILAGSAEETAEFRNHFRDAKLPVLAIRSTDSKMELRERRAACDRLQRDLARMGDFAGYIV